MKLLFTFAFRIVGAVAQSVEQRTENPCVAGSIPAHTTLKALRFLKAFLIAGSSKHTILSSLIFMFKIVLLLRAAIHYWLKISCSYYSYSTISFFTNYLYTSRIQKHMETLFIKNMVCNRCILVVQQEMDKLNLSLSGIELGAIHFEALPSDATQQKIAAALVPLGFEIIDDKKSVLIEKIKSMVIEWVQYPNEDAHINFSDHLSKELGMEYSYLSKLFSTVESSTIERYLIAQKIEKVKELLVYDEMTLTAIADLLLYSSVAYLSNQFKKVTGLTPSHFQQIKTQKRKALDDV